ncbi:MAG: ParA family protein [Candidatus Glassbacteria bacterium]
MKKIAVITSKGGAGKTTTAVNLGHGLALKGKKVLLVDCDSQGSIGTSFKTNANGSLSDLFLHGRGTLTQVRPNLFILPSGGIRLAEAERVISNKVGREFILKNAMAGLLNVDYVLCDCSPSVNLININALSFSDVFILPVSMDFLAFEGAKQTLRLVKEVRNFANTELELLGILPTQYDSRTRVSRRILELLRITFQKHMFRTVIRVNTKFREAPNFGKSIFEYAPNSTATEDYRSLTEEVMSIL